MSDLFGHPWFSGLFGDAEADEIWSHGRTLSHMIAFEAAYSRGLGEIGSVSIEDANTAAELIEESSPDITDLLRGTSRDGLPVPALVRHLKSQARPLKHAIHTGTTSQDVMDTSLAISLRENSDLLADRLTHLVVNIDQLRTEFGRNRLMGRTRMQSALPISVDHRLAAWAAPLSKHQHTLERVRKGVERVQLGGPVGDGQAIGSKQPELVAYLAERLGLQTSEQSWHTNRENLVEYAGILSLITGAVGKIGQDICLMALQGVDEIKLSGGGGSSAMPHKRNPILAELLVTLGRYNATQIAGMHHALIHEQERSGSSWALEWMILPGMAKATARSLAAAITLFNQVTSIGVE